MFISWYVFAEEIKRDAERILQGRLRKLLKILRILATRGSKRIDGESSQHFHFIFIFLLFFKYVAVIIKIYICMILVKKTQMIYFEKVLYFGSTYSVCIRVGKLCKIHYFL